MLNVAIAVDSTTDYGPEAVHVVARACEEVIGEQRCPVASDLPPGAVAAWYAVVHPNDRAWSSVRIEFRDRTADGVLIEDRALSFGARDSLQSRLASVGSVIAALAAAREGAPTRPPGRASSAPPLSASTAPPPESAAADWSVELAALVAPTFGDGPYRIGGLGRVQLGLSEHLLGLVSARYALHPGNPDFAWWTLSAGVGSRVGERAASLYLEFSAELVLEHTNISAERGSTTESASQIGWGSRVGVEAVWATWRRYSVLLGVDGSLVLPRINVTVGEQDATHVPIASFGLFLGARFQP